MTQAAMVEGIVDKLLRWPDAPIFVALDGALFSNLPRLLTEAGFEALSLFVGQNDPEIVQVAPQLVSISRDRLSAFLELPGITLGGVFWNAPGCERMAFFRHLRSLSMVRIPVPDDEVVPDGRHTRMVVLRHFDPATVAITLPALRPAQRARMFGPAQSLLIATPDAVLEAKRRDQWPEPERGWLNFTREQMAEISAGLELRSRRKIVAYLRETVPDHAVHMTDEALLGFVEDSERRGKEWGLTTQASMGRFAWFQYISGGDFARHVFIRAYVTDEDEDPDARLAELMTETEKADWFGSGDVR